jgi:hypothetical protein
VKVAVRAALPWSLGWRRGDLWLDAVSEVHRVPTATPIADEVLQAGRLYHRLVLVVGPPRSGKTRSLRAAADASGWPVVNVNLALCEKLLELPRRQRPIRAAQLLGELVEAQGAPVVALDNLEVVFDPELQLNPLSLLQGLSRNVTLVVAWPGAYEGEALSYAEPGHPEARKYPRPDCRIVALAAEDSR